MKEIKIEDIDFRFDLKELVKPFKIGNKPPMKFLEYLTVKFNGNGIGGATMANVWANAELDAMKSIIPVLKDLFLNKSFVHPLGLYRELYPKALTLVTQELPINAVAIGFSAFDMAAWDLYGKFYGLHPCQCLTKDHLGHLGDDYYGGGFDDIILGVPKKSMGIIYTQGAGSNLIKNENDGGLVYFRDRERRKIFKLKCTGVVEVDFREILSVGFLIGPKCRLWLDYNGSSNLKDVKFLLEEILRLAPKIYNKIQIIEQPFSIEETLDPLNAVHGFDKPFAVDESVNNIDNISTLKKLGYRDLVGKVGKGGPSASLLMALAAKKIGMGFAYQDLTNDGQALRASISISSYLGFDGLNYMESNGGQFLRDPELVLKIRNGKISTDPFVNGPGW